MWTPGICMMDGCSLIARSRTVIGRKFASLHWRDELGGVRGRHARRAGGARHRRRIRPGRATALERAACGARVMLAGRRAEVLAEAAASLDGDVNWVAGDI